MFVYTFIMNYAEGTYVSQVSAKSEVKAMQKWIKELYVKSIDGLTEADWQNIIKDDFSIEDRIIIKGCTNVWCFGLRTNKKLALVNFVKTVTE